MADIYKHEPLDADVLDPNKTISHWRILESREKSQNEINDERMKLWRQRYDAHMSVHNWKHYQNHSRFGT